MFEFQFCLIAWIDDMAHMFKGSIKPCPQFPEFALSTRLCWSKNVHEERQAPKQIVLGAMNPMYCVLIALSIYLEVYIASGEGRLGVCLFGEAGRSPDAVKGNEQQVLKRDVLDNPVFHRSIQQETLALIPIKSLGLLMLVVVAV